MIYIYPEEEVIHTGVSTKLKLRENSPGLHDHKFSPFQVGAHFGARCTGAHSCAGSGYKSEL